MQRLGDVAMLRLYADSSNRFIICYHERCSEFERKVRIAWSPLTAICFLCHTRGARKESTMTAAQTTPLVSAAEAYREKMFNLLGDKNPLDVMAQTASALAEIVSKHPAMVLRTRPFAGKWTPNEIIGHLTDSEWVYGYRLRLILSEDNPPILGTRQDAWVAALRYNELEPAELVEMFRSLRRLNLAEWRRIPPAG